MEYPGRGRLSSSSSHEPVTGDSIHLRMCKLQFDQCELVVFLVSSISQSCTCKDFFRSLAELVKIKWQMHALGFIINIRTSAYIFLHADH